MRMLIRMAILVGKQEDVVENGESDFDQEAFAALCVTKKAFYCLEGCTEPEGWETTECTSSCTQSRSDQELSS